MQKRYRKFRSILKTREKVKYPLRKIIEKTKLADGFFDKQHVILECGHEIRCSSGSIYKARCYRCPKKNMDSEEA